MYIVHVRTRRKMQSLYIEDVLPEQKQKKNYLIIHDCLNMYLEHTQALHIQIHSCQQRAFSLLKTEKQTKM